MQNYARKKLKNMQNRRSKRIKQWVIIYSIVIEA